VFMKKESQGFQNIALSERWKKKTWKSYSMIHPMNPFYFASG
jgi:hypothetical protein